MNARKPAAAAPKDGALLWILKALGVALASALLAVAGGIGLAMTDSLLAAFAGSLAGIVLAVVLFHKRRWVAMPAGFLAMILLFSLMVITPSTRDARRAEGEQLLGNARNQVRVAYAKTKGDKNIRTLTGPVGGGGCGIAPAELSGKYYRVLDEVIVSDAGVTLRVEPMPGYERDGSCSGTFAWGGGDAALVWKDPPLISSFWPRSP